VPLNALATTETARLAQYGNTTCHNAVVQPARGDSAAFESGSQDRCRLKTEAADWAFQSSRRGRPALARRVAKQLSQYMFGNDNPFSSHERGSGEAQRQAGCGRPPSGGRATSATSEGGANSTENIRPSSVQRWCSWRQIRECLIRRRNSLLQIMERPAYRPASPHMTQDRIIHHDHQHWRR